MVPKRILKLHCPTCKTVVTQTHPEFPFCSERCRTIDLGKWASGAFVIRSPVQDISDEPQDSGGEGSNER